MVNDPNLFDNNLASFPEETTGFEGGPSFLDSLDTNEPGAAELPDATPLDPRMTQYELEPPGSQGTDPFDASATGWPIEHSAEPNFPLRGDQVLALWRARLHNLPKQRLSGTLLVLQRLWCE